MADRLGQYNAKRDFTRTGEPRGEMAGAHGDGLRFLVQKHDATRLHYDLRLEWDGVLWSWAVTRGPSDDPAEKRLAVRTEDHPLSYAEFEGTIPEGEYGGGTVMLWDQGTWHPLHDPAKGIAEGKLHFEIDGERMKGGWALVRMRGNGEKRENWLLIKERDAWAGDDPDALTEDHVTSISTAREMDAIAKGAKAKKAKPTVTEPKTQRGKRPAFRKPQLATLVDEAPEGDAWLHETKFDGYRCLAALGKGGPRLYTRSGKDWTDTFARLVTPLLALDCESALIDGEVMAAEANGSPFNALQSALKTGDALLFQAFDLLSLDGEDLTKLPLVERKDRLAAIIPSEGAVRFSEHITGQGAKVYAHACEAGIEGIISKQADAPYRGGRGRSWLKVKCTRRQEFVIGGWAPSESRTRPFASLLLGQYDGDALTYRGRVGTGFDTEQLSDIAALLDRRGRKTSPFESVPRAIANDARWVTPNLVAEIEFTELTDDGHVRHGVFQGLRGDKPAREVVPEVREVEMKEIADDETEVAGLRISSGERRVFGKAKITKLDVARYYEAAAEKLLAISSERPFSLVRCPSGIDGECFYQKHAGQGFPEGLHEVDIEESDGGTEPYMYARDAQGLAAAAQMGTIEFHVWGARVDRLDRPDRLVLDLDPDEGLGFAATRRAAVDIRDRLSDLGLDSIPVVTGGKGIHVTVPLRRTIGWDTLKTFARTLATWLAEDAPERYVATMSKSRRKGRIFIDWLRNERGSTAIAPWSLRARDKAPVAVPVTWDELAGLRRADAFRLPGIGERLEADCPLDALDLQSITKTTISRLERALG